MSLVVKTTRLYKKEIVDVLAQEGTLSKILYGENEVWVKTDVLKPVPTKRQPKSLVVLTITPDDPFIEYLKTPEAATKLSLEAQCEEMDFAVRKQYTAMTGGDELVVGEGYNVAPHSADKQGCEGSVSFNMPKDESIVSAQYRGMMKQRPGLINRIGFVWALVGAGFKVTRSKDGVEDSQVPGPIGTAVPLQQ